jgi:hypothetical protein
VLRPPSPADAIVRGLVGLIKIGIITLLVIGCAAPSEVVARSGPAVIGVPVPGAFHTGCGLGQTVFDIDRSLWQPMDIDLADTKPPEDVASPNDEGTLTLVRSDRAAFTSSTGAVFMLSRREGSQVNPGC